MLYNFSPGPSLICPQVSKQLAETLVSYQGNSVLEISHYSDRTTAMIKETNSLLKEIAGIPDTHEILWSHGGASLHFAAIPMNLVNRLPSKKIAFVDTGLFADFAEEEARKYGNTIILASSKADGYRYIPEFTVPDDISYLHIVPNNTTDGTSFQSIPDTEVPIIGDFTSEILSRQLDYFKFGIIFAGVQKNLGLAGLSLIIIRKDLMNIENLPCTPYVLSYKTLYETESYANTPNTTSIYSANLTLKWIKEQGGLAAIEALNRKKSNLIYSVLDNSDFYIPRAHKEFRSIINVTFDLPSKELLEKFIEEAAEEGLLYLRGYETVGGIRASMYNAFPLEGAVALADFMKRFETKEILKWKKLIIS